MCVCVLCYLYVRVNIFWMHFIEKYILVAYNIINNCFWKRELLLNQSVAYKLKPKKKMKEETVNIN